MVLLNWNMAGCAMSSILVHNGYRDMIGFPGVCTALMLGCPVLRKPLKNCCRSMLTVIQLAEPLRELPPGFKFRRLCITLDNIFDLRLERERLFL